MSDPLWRMPLWKPYDEMLASDVADFGNASDAPMAGAVTAALFLQKFVPEDDRPGRISTPSPGGRRPSRAGRKAATRSGLRAAWDMLESSATRLIGRVRGFLR